VAVERRLVEHVRYIDEHPGKFHEVDDHRTGRP
jgi:hypothetical protein